MKSLNSKAMIGDSEYRFLEECMKISIELVLVDRKYAIRIRNT